MTQTLNKSQKMVKILQLASRKGGVRAVEVMERFELDKRALRRYLADLRDLPVPVHDQGRGDERVIEIDPSWRRTGVQLTLTEVLSLHFGRTLFNFLEGTSFAGDMDDAIERLEPAISRADALVARQLDKKFIAISEHAKDYRGDRSDVIDEVISALVYNNPVTVRYRKASGVTKTYRLHPFSLATFRQGLYIFALDTEANLVKTFAVERCIEMVRQRGHTFAYPTHWEPRAHLAHAFGIIDGPPEDVVLAFSEQVAGYIRERSWHPTQQLSTLPDGRLRLRMSVAVTVELRTWILGHGADVEVLSPSSLVDRIRDELAAAAKRYQT
ncbi:MAG: WYL domain-containing protein [Deltaproteobacteria bacterium]|nr:MAG: WYL domain-containing protein [Deltaproteobacteria bacterium]